MDGLEILWASATDFERSSVPKRVLNYATFLISLLGKLGRAPRPDVVLCMTDPPVIGLLGLVVARTRRARFVLVSQDVYPEVGIISGRLTRGPIVAVLRQTQRILLRKADTVVAIGRAMKQRLVERGGAPGRIEVIPNGIDLDRVEPVPRDNPWAREHATVGRFTVMHSGNVGFLQALETLIEAAAELPEIQFYIVGEGSSKQKLEADVKERGPANVHFLPHQPREVLPQSLGAADVHVVSLLPGLSGFIEPSKIYGVLAAGRPAVASVDADSEAALLVREANCGRVTQPGDPRALAAAIAELAALPRAELDAMGQAARRLAEQRCDRDAMHAAYSDVVRSLAAARS